MATKGIKQNKKGGKVLAKVRRVSVIENEDQVVPGLLVDSNKKKESDETNETNVDNYSLPGQLITPKDRYEIERTLIIKGTRGIDAITAELNKQGIKIARVQVSRDLHEVNKLFAAEHEKFKKHWDVGVHLQTRLDDLKERRELVKTQLKDPKVGAFVIATLLRSLADLDEIENALYLQCGMDMAPPVNKRQQITIHHNCEPKGGWPKEQSKA